MILQSHPTTNAFNRALAEELHRAGILDAFHTTLAFGRRSVGIPRERLRLHPWPEIARLVAERLALRSLTRGDRAPFSVDAVYRSLDQSVSQQLADVSAVYCYEDGALATFHAAKERGLRRFYELPIAYWKTARRLLEEEAERRPDWAFTLGSPDDSLEKRERKTEEIGLADLVVCPSQFVQKSLPGGTRSVVAEFGSPPVRDKSNRNPSGPLRVLFAGAMTQRKGLADVFEAFRLLDRKDIELVVMGAPLAPLDFYRKRCPHFIHEPPRPQADVLDLMSTCDVLVLPSIVEGRALVQQEALSRGLPLIVTENAGGSDLIDPGTTGWLVPIRDPEAIADRVNLLADQRDRIPEMCSAAFVMAGKKTWADYTRKILSAMEAFQSSEAPSTSLSPLLKTGQADSIRAANE